MKEMGLDKQLGLENQKGLGKVFWVRKEHDQQQLQMGSELAGVKSVYREMRGRIRQIGGGLILQSHEAKLRALHFTLQKAVKNSLHVDVT